MKKINERMRKGLIFPSSKNTWGTIDYILCNGELIPYEDIVMPENDPIKQYSDLKMAINWITGTFTQSILHITPGYKIDI